MCISFFPVKKLVMKIYLCNTCSIYSQLKCTILHIHHSGDSKSGPPITFSQCILFFLSLSILTCVCVSLFFCSCAYISLFVLVYLRKYLCHSRVFTAYKEQQTWEGRWAAFWQRCVEWTQKSATLFFEIEGYGMYHIALKRCKVVDFTASVLYHKSSC